MTDRPVVEFDHHAAAFHAARHAEWAGLRRCPVAFNPAFGGFWAVSGYQAVAEVCRDAATFSSKHARRAPDGIDYLGIAGVPRPGATPTLGIAEVEGSRHGALRRVLGPYFAPTAVVRLRPVMASLAAWLLDQRIETGSLDLVGDLTSPLPAIVTLDVVGLPRGSWRRYVELFHGATAFGPGTPEQEAAMALVPLVLDELREACRRRRAEPRDDLLTALVALRDEDGQELTDDEVAGVVWNLVGGGVDTTSSLSALALLHLDEHRGLRRRIVEQPELLLGATEEYLRFYPVSETLSRTVTRQTVLAGQRLGRGDHVLVSLLSANRDRATFPDPDEVDIERAPNPHLAFGVGPHRCLGMHLARAMFGVLVREVLTRIPDYEVDRAATSFFAPNPSLHGVVEMRATFTPAHRVQPSETPLGALG